MYIDVLILGAGPTGLGAAWRMERSKDSSQTMRTDWMIIDAASGPGGMACTEEDDKGFRWDLGGHVIHSRYDAFNEAISAHTDWVYPQRGGWVRVKNQWCPTPIQRHLGNLKEGSDIRDELVALHEERLRAVAESSPSSFSSSSSCEDSPQNLGEYYRATFGPTLDSVFFSPFNFKQWAWPLSKLDHSWTSLRSGSKVENVPAPSTELHTSEQPEDVSSFPYPRLGTGSLWASIAAKLPASRQRYNCSVVAIDLQKRSVRLSDGETIKFGRCICTLPLNRTIDLVNADAPCQSVPATLAPALKHSTTTVTGLGFEGTLPKVLEGKSWIFGADAEVPFHRATVLSNFSKDLTAVKEAGSTPRWSIMFETSSSQYRSDVNLSSSALAEAHLAELRRWGAVEAGTKPISVWHKHLVLGYPIPFLGRDELLAGDDDSTDSTAKTAGILARLEAHGLVSRGRFGGWRYESSNQDAAWMQGVEAVDLILAGKPETVFWPSRPDVVKISSMPLRPRSASKPSSHHVRTGSLEQRTVAEASAFMICA